MHTHSEAYFSTTQQAEELFLEGNISLKLGLEIAHAACKQHRLALLQPHLLTLPSFSLSLQTSW